MSEEISLTIGGLLDNMAVRFPVNEVLVYHERGFRYSYHEYNQICRQVFKGLLAMGIKKGSHLSIRPYKMDEEECYASYSCH